MSVTKKDSNNCWLLLIAIVFALSLCAFSSVALLWHTNRNEWGMAFASSQPQIISIGDSQSQQTSTPFLPIIIPPTTNSPSQTSTSPFTTTSTAETTLLEMHTSTPVPTTENIPASSYISGLKGNAQWYTLDCEARSAVDWARFFGTTIDEQEFLDRMPSSDDPEMGFVGYINGPMGQLPPNDYGVHPPPVAELLSEFGVTAKAVDNMPYEELQREIAAGRPVIVWIVNIPFEIAPRLYTASNGNTSIVAPFEHTWIVTGYNAYTVTVVDSHWTYNVKLQKFLDRWAALGNRAIIYK